MKFFFFLFLIFCYFTSTASFPICLKNDTILIDGKNYRVIGVDSLYKYPLPNEPLSKYRKRIKKLELITSDLNNSKNKFIKASKPITFLQILGIAAIVILIINIIRVGFAINELS